MNKIVLVCSHLYSGSQVLLESMNQNPRIQHYNLASSFNYTSPLSFHTLIKQDHKMKNKSAIYMDHLLYNYELSTSAAFSYCKFLFVIRPPETVLNFLISEKKYKPQFAARHYAFRLRRICQLAKRCSGGVLLTWQDLLENRGIDLINDLLELKTPIKFNPEQLNAYKPRFSNNLSGIYLKESETAYEKYLYFLKNQNLAFTHK